MIFKKKKCAPEFNTYAVKYVDGDRGDVVVVQLLKALLEDENSGRQLGDGDG